MCHLLSTVHLSRISRRLLGRRTPNLAGTVSWSQQYPSRGSTHGRWWRRRRQSSWRQTWCTLPTDVLKYHDELWFPVPAGQWATAGGGGDDGAAGGRGCDARRAIPADGRRQGLRAPALAALPPGAVVMRSSSVRVYGLWCSNQWCSRQEPEQCSSFTPSVLRALGHGCAGHAHDAAAPDGAARRLVLGDSNPAVQQEVL